MLIPVLLAAIPAHAGTLEGVVQDTAGEPVAGIYVIAYDTRLNYASAVSTTAGRFSIVGLPGGIYRLRALAPADVDHPQRFWPDSWGYCDGEPIPLAEADTVDGLDFALGPGASVSGVLTDVDGGPIPGAVLTARGVDPRVANIAREALSGEDGAFTLLGLDADAGASARYTLEIEIDGWPVQFLDRVYDDDDATLVEARVGETEPLGEIELLDGISVAGTLHGYDGPVVGADVHVYASSQVISTTSDAEGRYVVDGLPPGDVLSWASEPGYGMTYYPDADRPGERVAAPDEGTFLEDVDLELPQEARFNGRFGGGDVDLSGVTVLLYNDNRTVGIGAQADVDGLFTVDRLHGGDYTLFVYAEAEGFLNDWIRDTDGEVRTFSLDPAEDSAVFDVSLPQGASVSGQLVDDAGAPVYGATVTVLPQNPDHDAQSTVTDRDGRFDVPGINAGVHFIEARYTAYCDTDPGYVTAHWPGEVNPDLAAPVTLAAGQALTDVVLELPRDDDHDGMSDAWEEGWGLDTTRDDSAEDPDGDGYTNLEEYLLGTDPTLAVTDTGCERGCGGRDAALILPLLPLALVRRRRRRA
ncbi:MAG: carboxypeptidase regulatory-like domain-containing protein [Alphaproteobacteria bacterium]|nr:carboxypeptidase regulatory-like domain-containing protein [Alphaproteobacteria bacterium]